MQRGLVGEKQRGTSLLFFIVAPPLRGSESEREGREWNKGYLMTNGIVNNVSHLYAVVSISSLLILYLIINKNIELLIPYSICSLYQVIVNTVFDCS